MVSVLFTLSKAIAGRFFLYLSTEQKNKAKILLKKKYKKKNHKKYENRGKKKIALLWQPFLFLPQQFFKHSS